VKPAPFEYLAPTTLDEAVTALSSVEEAKVLAGGQSLVPVLALRLSRFDALVDLNGVDELDYVRHAGNQLIVGAMTRQVDVHRDLLVRRYVPVLARATELIGHFQIRNRGTIGGSIAHGDPSAEYPAVAVTFDAEMTAVGPKGSRIIAARDFYDGPMTSTLDDHELLTAIAFPVWAPGSGYAIREVARREGDFATAGAVGGITIQDGVITRAAVGLFGLGPTPVRLRELESELVGRDYLELPLTELAEAAVAPLNPPSDIHASGSYRRRVAGRLVAQILDEAILEAVLKASLTATAESATTEAAQ
jgi:carbon-monoxide dehydrogenase medium subunit